MAISSLDLAAKSELAGLAELVADLKAAAPAWQPLLVGATARDLLLHHAHEIPIIRATLDIDIGFAVANWEEFATLRNALVASAHFETHPSLTHRFSHRRFREVDLIPFGGLELPDGSITWPPRGGAVMTVVGYREALQAAVEVSLPGSQQVLVTSLAMLVVLKLIAWSERHVTTPRKDAADIVLILRHYLDAGNQQRLYDEAAHLLDDEHFDYERAGAWLAGHDARQATHTESHRQTRVHQIVSTILDREADPDGPLTLIGEVGGTNADAVRLLLTAFLNGFTGISTP